MSHPLSMTCFGGGEAQGIDGRVWTVEIRSVNHRYADIIIKMPRKYAQLEERLKKEVAGLFSRGRIEVMVAVSGAASEAPRLEVDLDLAREYYRGLVTIYRELSLQGPPPDLQTLVSFRDLIVPAEEEEDLEAAWPTIRQALQAALENGMQMRRDEGATLKQDLTARLAALLANVDTIEKMAPELVVKKETALKERLDNLLKGVDIDPARLAQEVAILADKADVTEELVRLRSHCQQFSHFLDIDEPVGRRLDFLLQEFLREINTMASKINDATVAHLAVELKNEVEKMREQVQNLE